MGIDSGYGIGSLKTGVCTSTTRPAVPFEGQTIYETDTDLVKAYNGASWVTIGPVTSGLVCVKAETTVTASASATADSIFTSSYTNYLLLLNYSTSTTQSIEMQFRVGGVSATTNYTYQTMQGFVATPSTNAFAAQSSASIGYYSNAAQQFAVIQIGNVQLAKATSYVTQGAALAGALNYGIQGTHTTATAYDGINILVASGTWTGTYAVYGYSKTV